jgi:hypothetical protein
MIQNITLLSAVPLRSEATDETAYRQGVEAFLNALKQLSEEFGVSIPQFNSTATTINEKEASAVVAATTATTQASMATTKASAAAASAIAAYNAQIGAEAALDAFDDKYLGAKSIFPTVDNDGDPLQMGATFWKSTSPKGFYVYDSELSTWQQYSFIPTSHGSLSGREDVDAHPLSSITGVSAFARTLLDDMSATAMRATLGIVEIGSIPTNVTANRALGGINTNNTGKLLPIFVSTTYGAGSYSFLSISINGGTAFPFAAGASPSGVTYMAGFAFVPVGASYKVTASNGSLYTWYEYL